MHVVAILRMVPDVVEDLEVSPSGTALEPESVRLILSECDDHALQQALLLRESRDAIVTVLVLDSLDSPETEEVLYTALAKGPTRRSGSGTRSDRSRRGVWPPSSRGSSSAILPSSPPT